MADSGQKTEKATQRRLEKARKEGNFPASREFISSVQFLGFVTLLVTFGSAWLIRTMHLTRILLARAFTGDLTAASLVSVVRQLIAPAFVPLMMGGATLVVLVVALQLA